MLPGGKLETGETPLLAAERELIEETTIAAPGLRYLFEFIGKSRVHYVYGLTPVGPPAANPQNEIRQCQWFDVNDVTSLGMSKTMRTIVVHALEMMASEPDTLPYR